MAAIPSQFLLSLSGLGSQWNRPFSPQVKRQQMARTFNSSVAFVLFLVFGIVFFNGFFLWHSRSNLAKDMCFTEGLGLHGKVAVALAFAERQAGNALDALKGWDSQGPCEHRGVAHRAVLLLYGDMDMSAESEGANALRRYAAESPNIKACFSEVAFVSANLSDADDVYDKKRTNHLWTRGPNMMFYNLMFEHLTKLQIMEVQHLFWMEPDVTPVQSGWLDKLLTEAAKGDYWIQGSAFRGKCLPWPEGKCEAIGRDIISHINGNALYHTGDLNFVKFMFEVANGKFMHWPFDLAPLMHMQQVWTELEYREKMHLYQRVDWIRNYGPYPVDLPALPSSVLFAHFSPPLVEGEVADETIVLPEIDEWMAGVIKNENGAAQKAVDLERQVAQLLATANAQTVQTLPLSDDVAPSNETQSNDAALRNALEGAANKRRQVIVGLVTAGWHDMLANFAHHLRRVGALENLVLVAVDSESFKKFGGGKLEGVGGVLDLSGGSPEEKDVGARVRKIRYGVLVRCLKQGYHVLSSDLDIVWQRAPFKFFQNELDLQVQSNSRTGFREQSPGGKAVETVVGAGLHYSVARTRVVEFWEGVAEAVGRGGVSDADAMHELLVRGRPPLRWRILEPTLFPNGALFFESTLPQSLQIAPIALHNNWADNRASAIYRLREANLWAGDPPEYSRPGGRKFLTFWDPLEDNGLNNQRMALRNALAFARLLNRTLILPVFHRDHMVDSPVPYDFFFDYEALQEHFPGVLPQSFLATAFPEWEKLPVQYINNGPPSPVGEAWWPRAKEYQSKYYHLGASQEEILGWFGGNNDQVLIFYNMVRRFGKFDDAGAQEKFHRQAFHGIAPNPIVVDTKDQIVNAMLQKAGTEEFSCLHLRRGDTFMLDHPEEKPISEVGDTILQHVSTDLPLYVCTDVATDETRNAFLEKGFKNVFFVQDFFPPWRKSYVESPSGDFNMRYGQIDQLTCSKAKTFIGNIYSTFTWHIAYLRQMNGLGQVCQDVYDRQLGEGQFFI